MAVVERVGEALARRLDRRRVVGRAAAAAFGAVAAWAVEGIGAPGALALTCSVYSSSCHCNYPRNRQCDRLKHGSCNGSQCGGGCRPQPNAYTNSGGCWCTQTCNGGYYECCDCQCPGGSCGCSKFVPV